MTKQEAIDYAKSHLEVRYATKNRAYNAAKGIRVTGCVNHSIGCPQPSVEVMYKLMNSSSVGWGVNAILGDFDKGEGKIILAMPYNTRPWGCGNGRYGSWNNSRIQWEVCEPSGFTYAGGTMIGYDVAKNQPFFDRMWKLLVCWNVYIADLLGYDYTCINDHAESYKYGYGCNHGDLGHWLPKHGKSMDALRAEVAAILNGTEEKDLTEAEVLGLIDKKLKEKEDAEVYQTFEDVPDAYKPALKVVMDAGILRGYNGGKDGDLSTVADNTIRVDEMFCRTITLLYRAGVLKANT